MGGTVQRNGVLLSFRNASKSLRRVVLRLDLKTLERGFWWWRPGMARKMVRNVKRILERHPGTAYLLPSSRDQWAADAPVEREAEWRDPSVLARGLSQLTGARADVVMMSRSNTCIPCAARSPRPPARTGLRDRTGRVQVC